jgi:hypothetical protein
MPPIPGETAFHVRIEIDGILQRLLRRKDHLRRAGCELPTRLR